MIPSIDPADTGNSGLIWLLLSYGYVLFVSANLISKGLDLLLLVPSLAGLVGSCVLPLFTAIPDGAIMLFSGLGPIDEDKDTLSVGVGALAGSTILVLTLPWAASIVAGRVDINRTTGELGYKIFPKLSKTKKWSKVLFHTGVEVNKAVRIGGKVTLLTALPYLLIQLPATYLTSDYHEGDDALGDGESFWSLFALLASLAGFFGYLTYQLRRSQSGMNVAMNLRRESVTQKAVVDGMLSLSAALGQFMLESDNWINSESNHEEYKEMSGTTSTLPTEVYNKLLYILNPIFLKYDSDPKDGMLNQREMHYLFRDMHEEISETEINTLFHQFDMDRDGRISFDEFIHATAYVIKKSYNKDIVNSLSLQSIENWKTSSHSFSFEEEVEEMPKDLANKRPEMQQTVIKVRAVAMLLMGTTLILLFSEPLVAVMEEIAERSKIPSFYVSFVIVPVISNAPEIISTQFYARKKTRKSLTIALSALQGSAVMNNTVCLSIFMGLVHFRGLAW
eukprot:CAMPEP_0194278352 /NCGR_PEP_ID=MMETSP0169-20130528/10414_1 /TAXON_ID=218684 /ORGANISM="Corethron pennatum, Strain L29A3" /LENGTH=505 /DNA_ID=CAMNT_0039022507 /DNA_START=226 /DNA_END=1740 /DNA_ORIENTATION=+